MRTTGRVSRRIDVVNDVLAEAERADGLWGPQDDLPDGTATLGTARRAVHMRERCEYRTRQGYVSWRDILEEEVAEALAESNPARLRAELVQVAAVALRWIESIDRRQP